MSENDNIQPIIKKKIGEMLDEDCLNRPGTAEKASKYLLEKAIDVGREKQFKAAMKFWKNSHRMPEDVLVQWFEGVFRDTDKPKKKSTKSPSKSIAKASKTSKVKSSKKS